MGPFFFQKWEIREKLHKSIWGVVTVVVGRENSAILFRLRFVFEFLSSVFQNCSPWMELNLHLKPPTSVTVSQCWMVKICMKCGTLNYRWLSPYFCAGSLTCAYSCYIQAVTLVLCSIIDLGLLKLYTGCHPSSVLGHWTEPTAAKKNLSPYFHTELLSWDYNTCEEKCVTPVRPGVGLLPWCHKVMSPHFCTTVFVLRTLISVVTLLLRFIC